MSYTAGERFLAGAGLIVAVLGLLNWAIWQQSALGLTSKQIAIVAFIPAALIFYYVTRRPDSRRAK